MKNKIVRKMSVVFLFLLLFLSLSSFTNKEYDNEDVDKALTYISYLNLQNLQLDTVAEHIFKERKITVKDYQELIENDIVIVDKWILFFTNVDISKDIPELEKGNVENLSALIALKEGLVGINKILIDVDNKKMLPIEANKNFVFAFQNIETAKNLFTMSLEDLKVGYLQAFNIFLEIDQPGKKIEL